MSITDTNQASELFELCKEVYELFPEWETEDIIVIDKRFGGGFSDDLIQQKLSVWKKKISDYQTNHNVSDEKITEQFAYYPVYTSDYLLEKLPNSIRFNNGIASISSIAYSHRSLEKPTDSNWCASYKYEGYQIHSGFGDTPLKALLKLTIALSEAGELS